MRSGKAVRPWLSSRWVLLVVALGALLSGCMEVLPSPAPRADVVSAGLGSTRGEWEHDHKLDGPFTRELEPVTLNGLVYDGRYRVTYWVDGPQEAAPSSARISRIEFDTAHRDLHVLKAMVREMLPDDAVLTEHFDSNGGPSTFKQTFYSQSLSKAYGPLESMHGSYNDWYWSWRRVRVKYSPKEPNIVMHMDVSGGIPPGSLPTPVPTLPAPLTPPLPSL
ncbi:MAG: hypothetical protein M3437_01345 [Chloroflexota bacterium]|nr:hypothetical protein [Chloroflexota bacterium]MDQ5867420.1 hypothetical protein [Chloroflexota bacterium]